MVVKLTATDGKQYNTTIYTAKGIYEICRWSRKDKADVFYEVTNIKNKALYLITDPLVVFSLEVDPIG